MLSHSVLDKARGLAILSSRLDNTPPRVDLNAVAIFARVVELQGFRGAARALGVPRSTVSAKVAELERQLGVQLLERTTRTVRPTDAGRRYLQAALPALEALLGAGRTLGDLLVAPTGSLRITAPPELGYFLLGRVLSAYLSLHPEVKIEAELTARRVDLVDEGFDLAIRAGTLADSSLLSRALGPAQPLVLCASPGYLERRGEPELPRELPSHDCLVMSDRQERARWEFREGHRRLSVEVEPRVAIGSFIVLRDLAVAGCGITWLPAFVARPGLQDGSLRALLSPYWLPPRAYHALYPRSRALSPKVRVFLDVLAEQTAALVSP